MKRSGCPDCAHLQIGGSYSLAKMFSSGLPETTESGKFE